jgi:anti-sigma factor RsiW
MSVKPYLPCKEIISFLADYVDAALPADTLAEFERHLAVCPSCVAYLASYRETIRTCRELAKFDESVSDAAPDELIEAILKSRRDEG